MSDSIENVEDVYALTPLQEGMLFHTISAPGSGVYVEQFTCLVPAGLEVGKFKQAWQQVFEQHRALRTIFLWEDVDEPLQVVRKAIEIPWREEDWSEASRKECEDRWQTFVETDRAAGFELTSAPVSRMKLVRVDDGRHRFCWTFHHLLLDGWSAAMVLNEVRRRYDALVAGGVFETESSPDFSEYVAWQQDQDLAAAETFWRRQLKGFTETNELRLHNESEESGWHLVEPPPLCSGLTKQMTEFARANRITLNTLFHGAWALLLSRFTGREDVVFGSTVSGRSSAIPGVEQMVGCCINTLPLRARVNPDEKTAAWLHALQEQHVALREFEYAGLNDVQKWSELPSGSSLFDSIVVFENYPTPKENEDGLRFENADLLEQSNFPLALLVIPAADSIRMIFAADGRRFPASMILERLQGHLRAVLDSIINAETLGEVRVIDEKEEEWLCERAQVLDEVSAPSSVLDTIAKQVAEKLDHPAIRFEGEKLSYAELDERANVLAARLSDLGVQTGDRVGLCVNRSFDMIVGILGILKAGGAYVPLDPNYPAPRLQFMLEDSGAKALVAHDAWLDFPADQTVLMAENVVPVSNRHGRVETPPHSEDFAYVIYTSGSMGRPKGVGVTHGNLAFSTHARFACYEQSVERFLLLSSFGFDSSIVGIFWTLCSGGTLVLPEEKLEQDIDALAELMETERVTHTLCLPSLYDVILRLAPTDALDYLRVVMVAGEACPPALVQRHFETLSNCRLYNEYGPTEGTVWCTVAELKENEIPTIGKPIPGVGVSVRDERLRLVPGGVSGELCLGGPGVVPGYLSDEVLTKQRFVPDPENPGTNLYRTGDRVAWRTDGQLQFLGRMDEQLKIRGHRIEPGEIESVLREHESVGDAVVMMDSVGDSIDELLAELSTLDASAANKLLEETF